ncbi:MAG TPA: WYL domain-containing protein [Lamprocystis sp. (in: g-proteobacteria)]|nr:WYL domain-containing protein [Lamprocystis sp. (in: g-proteobacteria)]
MNHDMLRRFAFIETRLLWGGGFTASGLAAAFGIARQNAQQTIAAYCRRHPRQMVYDRGLHRQVRSDDFKVNYVRDDVGRFLEYQRAIAHTALYHDDPAWVDLPFADADDLVKPLYDKQATRNVLGALRRQEVVEIEYWSKQATQVRHISPHHLVFADGRYHVRAYCHDLLRWFDFVLPRIVSAQLTGDPWVSEDGDIEWHQREDLSFIVNPALPESAQAAVRLDYLAQETEVLLVKGVRKALSIYVKRRLCRRDWRFEIPLWVFSKGQWP